MSTFANFYNTLRPIALKREHIARLHETSLAKAGTILNEIRKELRLRPKAMVTVEHYCKYMAISIDGFYKMQENQLKKENRKIGANS